MKGKTQIFSVEYVSSFLSVCLFVCLFLILQSLLSFIVFIFLFFVSLFVSLFLFLWFLLLTFFAEKISDLPWQSSMRKYWKVLLMLRDFEISYPRDSKKKWMWDYEPSSKSQPRHIHFFLWEHHFLDKPSIILNFRQFKGFNVLKLFLI